MDRVDAPLIDDGCLQFHDKPMFNTPPVPRFIHRTEMFKLLGRVEVSFRSGCIFTREDIFATFRSSIAPAGFSLSFPCPGLPAQVAIMAQICAQWPPLVSHADFLELDDEFSEENKWSETTTVTLWQRFLRPFTAVQTLRLPVIDQVPHVAHMMGQLKGERATEVLPALRTIELQLVLGRSKRLSSKFLRLLGPFLDARKELGRPVVVNVGYKF
jgi:hypothetical protein